MEYLAFDLEIARNVAKLPFDEFKPDDEEKIEALVGPDDWVGGTFYHQHDAVDDAVDDEVFVTAANKEIEGLFWRPAAGMSDWKRFRPLGITCAAAASSDGGLWNWWAHDDLGRFTDKMSEAQCWSLVKKLALLVDEGYTLLTWNGLGFDFDILAEESADDMEICSGLALNHVDMMFHFFASKGFPLNLDKASKGMGLPGKPEGMDGAKAPELWPTDPHKVLSYCSLDAQGTLDLAEAVDNAGYLGWTAQSGRANTWHCDKWLTVKEAIRLPEPDNSWMSDPWSRSKFYGWTGYEPEEDKPPIGTSHLDPKDWQLLEEWVTSPHDHDPTGPDET